MAGLKFGAFLAPHHPIGENPVLQFRSDLELVEQLDQLGYEEFWCGEHHSTGWEMIASPEMFLAAAGERTHRIKLGTGVVSLPYHHPFIVAQRIVQLDHMTNGRAIFGSGPGALPSDAYVMGIDPMTQRDRQDESARTALARLRPVRPREPEPRQPERRGAQRGHRPRGVFDRPPEHSALGRGAGLVGDEGVVVRQRRRLLRARARAAARRAHALGR